MPLFAAAPYDEAADALGRLIAYIDFRKAMLTGDLPDFTCFVGTIVQETYQTHPEAQELSRCGEHQEPRQNARGRHSRGDA